MLLTVIKVYVYTQDHCTISTGESLKQMKMLSGKDLFLINFLLFFPADTTMSSGNAKIGHRAPQFKATAVMPDGQFKDISLADYKGKSNQVH